MVKYPAYGHFVYLDTNGAPYTFQATTALYSGFGIFVAQGSAVDFTNEGTLIIKARGIYEPGSDSVVEIEGSATVFNSGIILGAAPQTAGTVSEPALTILNDHSGDPSYVNNTGLLQGGSGVFLFSALGEINLGTVVNSGTIAGVALGVGNNLNGLSFYGGFYETLNNGDQGDITVINKSGGTISAWVNVISVDGATETIANYGFLDKTSAPVYETGFNYAAISLYATHGLLTNGGTIKGGVYLAGVTTQFVFNQPGEITINNLASGTIDGSVAGITAIYIDNAGTIAGAAPAQVSGFRTLSNEGLIQSTGTAVQSTNGNVTNTGTIIGATGVELANSETLHNAGIITGQTGLGVQLEGSNRLVFDPGAVIKGGIGGAPGSSTLELTAGPAASTGTIDDFSSGYEAFGSIVLDPNASWVVSGAGAKSTSGITLDAGSQLQIATTGDSYLGQITGAGSLTENGPGMTTLVQAGKWTGGTTVEGGTLRDSYQNASGEFGGIGSPGSVVTLAGGTLLFTSTGILDRNPLSVTGAASIAAATGQTLAITGAHGGVSVGAGAHLTFGASGDTGTIMLDGGPGVQAPTAAIEVAAGTLTGAVGVLSPDFLNVAASTTVDAKAELDLVDATTFASLNGDGTVKSPLVPLTVDAGTFNGAITGIGSLIKAGTGTLTLGGTVGATGVATIQDGTLLLSSGKAASSFNQGIAFGTGAGSHPVLALARSAQPASGGTFAPTLTGFNSTHDALDLVGLPFQQGAAATYNSITHSLMVTSDGVTEMFSLLGGTVGALAVTADAAGTGLLVEGAACFCAGTAIATEAGEVPVETIQPGDRVLTVDGRAEPVIWVGRRSYAGRFLHRNPDCFPICIRAGALGGGLPRRDLRVSAKHALLLDGVLVPAGALTNGTSITVDRACEQVEYFHLELAQHDAIFAEGAAAETFLDDDSRGLFSHQAGRPGQAAAFVAPLVEHGWPLQAIRDRLNLDATRRTASA